MTERIRYGTAGLEHQGALGAFLLETLGPQLQAAHDNSVAADVPAVPVDEELMAADDFFFSSVDLMNCCILAHAGEILVGAACVNPYVGALMYVAVHAEWRRRGIGRELVARALAELERRGLDRVRAEIPLSVSTHDAQAFFDAVGFATIREVRETVRALSPDEDEADAYGADADADD